MGLAENPSSSKRVIRRRRNVSNPASPAIYKYHDAIEFPAVAPDHLDAELPVGVFIEASGTARKFQRQLPEFLADPDGVRLFSGFSADTITSSPVFVASARNARVVGYRTVLSENGFFFNDDCAIGPRQRQKLLRDLASSNPFNEETGLRPYPQSEPDGAKPENPTDQFILDVAGRPTRRIKGTTVLLGSLEPSNYGSWLFRVLPKLHTLSKVSLPEPVRYLVWTGFSTFREYLNLLGITDDQIIDHDPTNAIYRLEKLIVPSIRNNQAFLDAESVAFFSGLRSRFGGPVQAGTRIYVSRVLHSQNNSSRVLLNEPELIDRLVELDFRIITPEKLSVAEQIREFSSAEMVVGPSGSGMFNTVFCHPGTKVIDLESEPHWIHAHRCLFASCGMRHGIFVGSAVNRDFKVHHQPWKVNIGALISQITAFTRA